jgi:hypothetical protein
MELAFAAIVEPKAMTRMFGVKGHHAVVWEGGRAARWALFRSRMSDLDVRAGLERLGARPGENLSVETWTRREDRSNPEPDRRVEGTPVDVFISWRGSGGAFALRDLILERGQRVPQLDFRYGGNARHRTAFRSGCIVCLYSCPGGAIGNRTRTIRDYVRDGIIYASNARKLPPAGTEVIVILKPRLEAK